LPVYIKALRKQTLQNFEVHFCDDCSNDGTKEFFASKPDLGFPYQYHRLRFKWGIRLAQSINKGIKNAKGEYCVFIMGDSFPETNFLEVIDKHAHPDKILCGIRVNVENNKVVEFDWRLRKNPILQKTVLLPKNPFIYLTGNGLVVPTEAFRKYGGWNVKYKGYGGEDNELIMRLYYKGYLAYSIHDAVIYHWYHRASPSTKRNLELNEKYLEQYAQ
jgi:glycosyltransferase involved in cell wall biosynthesis